MNQQIRSFIYVTTIFLWMDLSGAVQAEDEQGITYSIISENEFQYSKHSINVRLNKKVSEQVLHSIATKLKELENKNYEMTFITYYLPDIKVGAGAWATTHFDPDLEIRILGLTSEEEEKMTQDAMSQPRDVVGIWMDDRPYVGSTITIYRENGKLHLEAKYKDGSGSTDEMSEDQSTTGTKLVEKGGNPHGEYFVLDSKGDLHAGDNEGLFLKYKKIQ